MILAHEAATPDYNRGVILLEKKSYKKALQYFKKAEKIFPCMEVYNNMGIAYRALGLDALMFSCYEKAMKPELTSLTGDPDAVKLQVLNNLGLAHYMYGRDKKALEYYRSAIKLNPKAWDCWWNSSTTWLRIASTSGHEEDFAHGWEMYKARFLKNSPIKMKNDKEELVYWDKKTPGESILVLVEQGIGDSLMFARYLPKLQEKFKKVYVQCDESLAPLFEAYGVATVQHASECDAVISYPIGSLGECFTGVDGHDWLAGLFKAHDFGPGIHVGIIFSGNPAHANDAYRSIPVQRFHALAGLGANLYCLQPGFTGDKKIIGLNPTNWLQTAEYINGLDLVISVDTSGIHLCGALGRPGWLLQPYKETDFRWGRVDLGGVFGSSVWYPNIRIFNNPQSWEFVFKNVATELKNFVANFKK